MAKPLMARATSPSAIPWISSSCILTNSPICLNDRVVLSTSHTAVARAIRGFDPVANSQLELDEIKKGEQDPLYSLKLKFNPAAIGEEKRRGPRYTPLSKRQDRPASIYWLVKFHPELTDGQISKLIGTTKPTIQAIRTRNHWNISSLQPIDPVALGLCKQSELDAAVKKAADKKVAAGDVINDDERRKLVSTEQSLEINVEDKVPSSLSDVENFANMDEQDEDKSGESQDYRDAEYAVNFVPKIRLDIVVSDAEAD